MCLLSAIREQQVVSVRSVQERGSSPPVPGKGIYCYGSHIILNARKPAFMDHTSRRAGANPCCEMTENEWGRDKGLCAAHLPCAFCRIFPSLLCTHCARTFLWHKTDGQLSRRWAHSQLLPLFVNIPSEVSYHVGLLMYTAPGPLIEMPIFSREVSRW